MFCFLLIISSNYRSFVFHKTNEKMKHMRLYISVTKVGDFIFLNNLSSENLASSLIFVFLSKNDNIF